MPAASPDWSSDLQQKVTATTNEDLQCLLRVANTPDERWRLVELLLVLGSRTAIQLLESNTVAWTHGTPGSFQQGRSPNSCAETSFQEVEALLEDAVLCPETASPAHTEAEAATHAQTPCGLKGDFEDHNAGQASFGCVGKTLSSSLRVIRGRKPRRNRNALQASPPLGSAPHSSTPVTSQPERDSELLPAKLRGLQADDGPQHADAPMPQQCGGRRALDYGRHQLFGNEMEAQARPRQDASLQPPHSAAADVRRHQRSMPASARRIEAFGALWNVAPSHSTPGRPRDPGSAETRRDESSMRAAARSHLPSMSEDAGLGCASEQAQPPPEVLFADTARSSQGQLRDDGFGKHCSDDPHSLEMARQALLRSTSSGRALAADAHGRHRRKLVNLLTGNKQGSQRNLIPSSTSGQEWSAADSEISVALHGLGTILTSTAASALQNPADLDHAEIMSKVDSSELVTMRGEPGYRMAYCHLDVA